MTKLKYLMCNLKSNKNLPEILEYKHTLNNLNPHKTNLVVFPSAIYLPFFYDAKYELGTQNLSTQISGSYTGEILSSQLASLKVKYCLLNHYDQHLSLPDIIAKIKNATQANIKVVLCLGEEQEQELNATKEYITNLIDIIFKDLTVTETQKIIIAYEPTWLINQNHDLNYLKITEIIRQLKDHLKLVYGLHNPIIYGGGINLDNISELLHIDIIDGLLLGRVCLNPQNILNILEKL